MDTRIEKIYLEELEKKTQEKFQDNGYVVTKCKVDAVLDTTKKNAGISLITIKIEKTDETEKLEKVKSELATEFEISEDKIKIMMK